MTNFLKEVILFMAKRYRRYVLVEINSMQTHQLDISEGHYKSTQIYLITIGKRKLRQKHLSIWQENKGSDKNQ